MSAPLPSPRILLGPGPSSVPSRVLEALSRAPIGYLDPELFDVLAEVQAGLRTVFGTQNAHTYALTGTGMAGMEACFANLVEPGDAVLVGVHGFFGERMAELAGRHGAKVTRVDAPWGAPLDTAAVGDAATRMGRFKLLACVHAETSTGVAQPLAPLAEIARKHDALFLADTVTSLGGLAVDADKAGLDASYAGTQKCLGCPPGLAPVTFSDRAWNAIASRKSRVTSWYYDLPLIAKYWGAEHVYHHTVPGNLLVGLRAALRAILDEGLAARFERHRAVSAFALSALRARGMAPFATEGFRLPTLNAVHVPPGVDDVGVRKRLLTDYGVEIGGGLGALRGKIWRIGTMGESAQLRNVTLLAAALDAILAR